MFDIVTVGSATVDCFVYTEKSDLITVKSVKDEQQFVAYPAGTKILIKDLMFFTGGGGTNTAVALARMGLKTGYLGALGNDENSRLILDELRKEKITFLGQRLSEKTDFSVVLNSLAHDRTILNYKGASGKLNFSKIRKPQTKWMYFSSLTGESYKTLEKLSDFCVKNKIKLAFNPSSYLAERGVKFLGKLLRNSNVLIMNKEEAKDITGKQTEKEMLSELRKFGCEYAIITDGKNGVYASCKNEKYFIKTHNVKVVEATGAGDTFASTFVGCLILGKDIKTSLEIGMVNAESNLRYFGAKEKLLSMPALRSHLRQYPYKVKKLK